MLHKKKVLNEPLFILTDPNTQQIKHLKNSCGQSFLTGRRIRDRRIRRSTDKI